MIPPSWIRSAVKNRRSLKYTGALSPSYLMRGSAKLWSFAYFSHAFDLAHPFPFLKQ